MGLAGAQSRGGAQPAGSMSILATARSWMLSYGAVALATLVEASGSSPIPIGGQLVISPDERITGAVSGGCVEVDVIAEASEVLATGRPKLLSFGRADGSACDIALPCGGAIKIFLERLSGAADLADLDTLLAAEARRLTSRTTTNLVSGARAITCTSMTPSIRESNPRTCSRIVTAGGATHFIHTRTPPLRLVLIGATNIAQALATMAPAAGMDVVVVDPRPVFADARRFDVPIIVDWPDSALQLIAIDTRSAIVTLTHAAHIDDIALRVALRSDACYIGALGSSTTHGKRVARLSAEGFSQVEIGRIQGPVGIDIGAVGPAEIAVSILAGLISQQSSRKSATASLSRSA